MNKEEYKVIGQVGNLKIEEKVLNNARIGGYIRVTNIDTGEYRWKEWKHWENGVSDRKYVIDMLLNFVSKLANGM